MLKYNLDIPKLFVYSDYYIYAKKRKKTSKQTEKYTYRGLYISLGV